jgi:hypothetical protein
MQRRHVCETAGMSGQWFPYPRAGMVRWYSPLQLAADGQPRRLLDPPRRRIRSPADRPADRRDLRPLRSLRPHRRAPAPSVPRDEIVVDYIADTGDGWNSTYAVAYTATRASLDVRIPTGAAHHLRRGELLVFGGDEVYPTPTRAAYEQRLVMPYHTAMGWTETDHPVVFAIPGNHDWYDNLTAFSHLFLDKQWFCGWRLAQRRSYFAIKLPHDWWLIGVDTQFGEDIDATQVAYFEGIAAAMTPPRRSSCAPPSRTGSASTRRTTPQARERRRRESNLVFLEDRVFDRARIKVNLSGDYHHYRRHASDDDRRQKITAGNGGAFLHPTHTFKKSALPGDLALRCAYPDHRPRGGSPGTTSPSSTRTRASAA